MPVIKLITMPTRRIRRMPHDRAYYREEKNAHTGKRRMEDYKNAADRAYYSAHREEKNAADRA